MIVWLMILEMFHSSLDMGVVASLRNMPLALFFTLMPTVEVMADIIMDMPMMPGSTKSSGFTAEVATSWGPDVDALLCAGQLHVKCIGDLLHDGDKHHGRLLRLIVIKLDMRGSCRILFKPCRDLQVSADILPSFSDCARSALLPSWSLTAPVAFKASMNAADVCE